MPGMDDLAPLLTGGVADGRIVTGQATILSYDPSDNTHTLDFRGAPITNVGVLHGISAMGYEPGHVVLLLGWVPQRGTSTWWILGRALIPGQDSPDLVVRGSSVTVEGGGDITVSGGGSFEALDGSRIRARYADGSTAVFWGSLVTEPGGDPSGHGLLVQDDDAGDKRDIFRAKRELDAAKNVFIGETDTVSGDPVPVDAFRAWATDLELYSLGDTDPDVLFLYSANRVFIEAEGNVQLQTSTAGGDIFLDSVDQISLLSGASQVFIEHATVGSDDNCVISSAGLIRRVVSARKYKQDIRDLHVSPRTVLDLRPRAWRDRDEVATDPGTDRWHVGFIAEEVVDAGLGAFVNYDENGDPSSLQYDRLTVALLETLKSQQTQIDALTAWASTQGFEPPVLSAETTQLPKRRPTGHPKAHQPRGRPERPNPVEA